MFGIRLMMALGLVSGLLLTGCRQGVDPAVGRIYNADGTFTTEVDSSRHPLGMVFACGAGVDSAYCYIVSLHEERLPFGGYDRYLEGDTSLTSLSGRTATCIWRDSCQDSPLVKALASYGKDWFVPSAGEWALIGDSLFHLSERLSVIEGATILSEGQYWCSTSHGEASYGHCAMAYDLSSGTVGQYAKRDTALFRPMIRVNLKASLWERLTGKQNV